MNCYNHPTETAVAQCSDCGKGLCHDCATYYTDPICNSCNSKRIRNEKFDIIIELLITYGFGILVSYFFSKIFFGDWENPSAKTIIWYYIFSVYVFSGVVSGWRTLTRITPAVFLVLPIIGWVIYFALKLFLAFWLGLIMLPIRTFRNIYRMMALQKVKTV